MYLLDTDHITMLDRGAQDAHTIREHIRSVDGADVAVSIVSYEEQMRGWLAAINARPVQDQPNGYLRLGRMLEFYCDMPIIPFSDAAAEEFKRLRASSVRIATMDLKISAIALVNDAIVVTRNGSDF